MCRRRNQTYIASTTSSAPLYTSNCRGRRQRYQHQQALVPVVAFPQQSPYDHLNPNSTSLGAQEQIFLRPAACKRERRGRCCNRNHNHNHNHNQHYPRDILATTTTYNNHNTHTTPTVAHQPLDLATLHQNRPRSGPLSSMASLVIAGIAIGAHKISEKRKEKKAQKASLMSQHGKVEVIERQEPRPRKSEEARLERRSSSVYSADERDGVPIYAPPSYDDAVAGHGSGTGARSGGV